MEYSMPLEKITADIDALVTGDTSQRFEQPIPVQFVRRQGRCITCEPAVEPAAGCYQSSLKAYDGVDDVRGVRSAAVGGRQFPAHAGVGGEFFHELGNVGAHDLRAFQYSFGIRLEGAEFSLPTKAEIERGIEYGKGVEREG